MENFKLGKKPRKRLLGLKPLSNYLKTNSIAIPDSVDNSFYVTNWGMLDNDKIGDCTIAGLGHGVDLWTAMAGNPRLMTNQEAITGYEKFGYNPNDPSTDQGAQLADVISVWMNSGFSVGGQLDKVAGFCSCNHLSEDEIKFTIQNLGFVYVGVDLPIAAQYFMTPGQSWDYAPDLYPYVPSNAWQAGSWGGHCIILVAANSERILSVTWGGLKAITWNWWAAYGSEAYGLLSKDFVRANVNWNQLETDMNELQGI